MSRQQSAGILAVVVALAIVLVAYLSPRADPFFDDDATAYIEAGRNFAQGRGFVTWPYGADDYGHEFVPLTAFPPGFPLLIAIGVGFGATAEAAATWIPRLCFVLMPLVLYRVLRFAMGRAPALVATAISCFAPPVVFHSLCAMSDVPFLFVALLGFAVLFHGVRTGRIRWLLLAGVIAGLAAGIRNAGYAIPVAVTAAFVLGGVARSLPLYLAGFGAGYAPVVLRNLLGFGTVQPYSMPPSGLPVGAVLREGLRAFDATFTAGLVPWVILVPALAGLLAVSVVCLRRAGNLPRPFASFAPSALAGSVLLLYAAAGVSMILITRLTFAVDPINPRFLIQYHWVFVAWCVLVGAEGLRTARLRSPLLRTAVAVGAAGVLLLPQVRVAQARMGEMAWSRGVAAEHEGLRDVITRLPSDACVVAFHAPQLHLMYGRPVYQLPPASPAQVSAFVDDDRPLVVVMFPFEWEQFRDWWGVFDGVAPDGYREIARNGDVVVLERTP